MLCAFTSEVLHVELRIQLKLIYRLASIEVSECECGSRKISLYTFDPL